MAWKRDRYVCLCIGLGRWECEAMMAGEAGRSLEEALEAHGD